MEKSQAQLKMLRFSLGVTRIRNKYFGGRAVWMSAEEQWWIYLLERRFIDLVKDMQTVDVTEKVARMG